VKRKFKTPYQNGADEDGVHDNNYNKKQKKESNGVMERKMNKSPSRRKLIMVNY
jgi:hypothetical protein